MNDEQIKDRVERIAEEVADQVRGLLIDYGARVEKAGAESDGKAKVSFTADWPAYSKAPKIHTKISYSVSHKDETERVIEFDQLEIDFAPPERVVKTVQPEPLGLPDGETIDAEDGDTPPYLKEVTELPDGWESMCTLPDDETLVEVYTKQGEIHRGSFGPDEVDEDETVFRCDTDDTVCTIDLLGWRHIEEEKTDDAGLPTRAYNFLVDHGQAVGNHSTARTINGKVKATSTAGDKFAANALLVKILPSDAKIIGEPKATGETVNLRGKTWHLWTVELQGWDYSVSMGDNAEEGDY
jgi:hypothetical protein